MQLHPKMSGFLPKLGGNSSAWHVSRQSTDPALAQISQQVTMFIPAKKIAVDRRSAISDHHCDPAPYPGVHCNTKVLWNYPVVLEKPQEQKTTLNSSLTAATPLPTPVTNRPHRRLTQWLSAMQLKAF